MISWLASKRRTDWPALADPAGEPVDKEAWADFLGATFGDEGADA